MAQDGLQSLLTFAPAFYGQGGVGVALRVNDQTLDILHSATRRTGAHSLFLQLVVVCLPPRGPRSR